jgi:hypothetical protein
VSPFEAGPDSAEGGDDAEGAAACVCLNLQGEFVCSMRMFFAAAEAQTYLCHVVKLRFFSSCFEYQDLFVGSRITYPSESYLSRKVMSEVSVSRRRRSPSARSASPLTCTLTRSQDSVIDRVEKARKIVLPERSLSVKTCSASRIAYLSVSYLSRKVMSEVSVSQRRRSPSARSALPLTCTPSFLGSHYRSNRKVQKTFWQKDFFRGKFSTQRGFPPSSPRGRVGLCRGKADPSLMVRLYLCM